MKNTESRKLVPGMNVIFIPTMEDSLVNTNSNDTRKIAAIITRVWGPGMVNLKVFPDCGAIQDRTSVNHISSAVGRKGYLWHFPDEEFEIVPEKPSKDNSDEIEA